MTQRAIFTTLNIAFSTAVAAVCAAMLWLIGIDPHTNAVASAVWFAWTYYSLTHKEQ